jgi:hypothetical protein
MHLPPLPLLFLALLAPAGERRDFDRSAIEIPMGPGAPE